MDSQTWQNRFAALLAKYGACDNLNETEISKQAQLTS